MNMNRLERAARAWAAAGLENDFIFSKVMSDPVICLAVIRSILPDLTIKRLAPPQTQQEVNPANDAKGVRFDIYTTDEHDNRYDIEMQVADHHNLAQRVRYYQAMNALDAYDKGANYHDANNSYVIFICCFDPFQLGAQFYSVNKHLNEFPNYRVLDGATDIYLNATSLRHEVPPRLQALLDLVAHRTSGQADEFGLKLREKIATVKHNKEWRADFMRLSLYEMDHEYELKEATEKGVKRGVKKGVKLGQSQGINMTLVQMADGLIRRDWSEEQVISFFTNVMKISREQAERYYRRALRN